MGDGEAAGGAGEELGVVDCAAGAVGDGPAVTGTGDASRAVTMPAEPPAGPAELAADEGADEAAVVADGLADGVPVPVGEGAGLVGDALGDWLTLPLGDWLGLAVGDEPCGPPPCEQLGDGDGPP